MAVSNLRDATDGNKSVTPQKETILCSSQQVRITACDEVVPPMRQCMGSSWLRKPSKNVYYAAFFSVVLIAGSLILSGFSEEREGVATRYEHRRNVIN